MNASQLDLAWVGLGLLLLTIFITLFTLRNTRNLSISNISCRKICFTLPDLNPLHLKIKLLPLAG